MKSKSMKELKNKKVLYCGLSDLFYCIKVLNIKPIYHNYGVYGFNNCTYKIKDIFLTTGFRNMIGKKIPDEIIIKLESYAISLLFSEKHLDEKDKKKMEEIILNEMTNLIV